MFQSGAGKITAVHPQGHILHGGKRKQLQDLSHCIRKERKGNDGALQQLSHRQRHNTDAVRSNGKKGKHIYEHAESRHVK